MGKLGKLIQNSLIGASVAEAPAVMTASGFYLSDPNSDWDIDQELEGLKELRRSLVDIGVYGASNMAAETLISAASRYTPQVLSKVAPKLKRFGKTLRGDTAKQARDVNTKAVLRNSRNAEKALELTRPDTDYLSTIHDLEGNRTGFVDAAGNVFNKDGKYIFNTIQDGSQSAFPGIQSAKDLKSVDLEAARKFLPNYGVRSILSYADEALQGVENVKDAAKVSAAVGGTGAILGTVYTATHKQGGILNYLEYVRN